MYGQRIGSNFFSPNVFKTDRFNYAFNKGTEVEQTQDWCDLLSKVAHQSCRLSFRKIFDHFYPALIALGMKAGLSREVSTELAQETMMRVWTQASTFEMSKGGVSGWIYIISRNLRYDYFRKLKNDPVHVSSRDLYSNELGNDLGEETNLEALFDLAKLRKVLEELPDEQSELIEKIYFNGLTQQEVADQDHIPLGTVKSRVRLAVATIKKLLGEHSS